ncbi:TPA: DUF859 domain-containing protein [Streptococcus pyogenes]|uniref:Phage structural protein n=1 Tax=Streptococcus anginosus TaxID=1328 RepID=A0A4U9Y4W1_STRAP|nr:DUF859 domain-containing protein [Streptococcus anginosus]HEQ9463627.1 DUF859 domain-containing protein [Streptococcus pyogenes]VTS20786.1 phage structural protein [Streptococcus anginosus]VTS50850.1 phage structural protein [Streptococcus anginosus]HEQ9486059.1 DUF859 domain-containing protein [Streptococcus pyogenes]HEQ9524389.1 DUF859 domain-containing protein [Streptococcus pyogenes]
MAEFWSNNDRGYRIRLWIDQASQNISGNSSQVRVRLALLNTTTTFAQYSCSAWVDLNGQRLNWSGSPSMTSYNSTIWLIDQTITVGHNADGTKSFGLSAHFSGSGGWSPGTLSIGGNSFTLTTIPRSSSVSVGAGTIGSSVTINISRQNSSFKHTVRYAWGNKSGTIASNVDTSTTWTIPLDFANDIPNSAAGTGTIYVDTYSGGTRTGTQSATLTASVPASMKPTFTGVSLSDSNTAAQNVVPNANTFIQIISNIKVAFNGASGSYGSNITGYRAEIVGKNQTTNVNGGTLGIMNYSGAITVRASVSDSRGRWSDTRDVSVTVLEYFAPALSFSIARTGATSSTLTVTRNAKVAPLTVSGSQKNSMTLSFKVARLGTNTYTPDTGAAAGSWTSISSLVNSQANLAGNYLANQSWVVIGTLEDKFTRTEFAVNVATESVVFSYDRNGVGVNKIRERGALDVKGDIYANDKPVQQYQLTQSNGQLSMGAGQWDDGWNKQATVIGWRSGKYDDNPTGKNGEWGLFQNYWLDSWKGAQFFTAVGSGRHFIRVYNDANSWKPTKWKEVAFTDHTNLINTGWQSANFPGTYYKRVGDILTVKYNFTGNGSTMNIGNIPSSVWVAPQEYMLVIAKWSIGGSDNSHVQINQGTSNLNVLSTGNGTIYKGQLTIMI